jgi:signal transduction histidine kinase
VRTAVRAIRETIQLILDLVFGIIGFTVVVTGLSLGVGMLITLIGIPILAATLFAARGLGWLDRGRANLLLGLDVPPPRRRPPGETFLRKLFSPFQDGVNWKASAYQLLMLPVGIVNFTVAVTIWSVALSTLFLPAYAWTLPHGGPEIWNGTYLSAPWQLAVATLVGLLMTLAAPWVIRPFALLDGALVRSLLGASVKDARIEQLQATRARSVDAAVEERRRIERDLHDGAQQRLVRLGMDLGLALDKFEEDPEGARELVDEAHHEAQRAIVELRDLVRGLHPAVLEDRGLDAALSALAARSPVPVSLAVDVPQRPPASVEANAYFIVAEALTNVAKHADATAASVDVRRSNGLLRIEVADDGRGGADAGAGSGLAGLADRAAAVDGTFSVASPPGGGTTLVVELPCAS